MSDMLMRLRVALVDRASGALKKLSLGGKDAAKELADAKTHLRGLKLQQEQIGTFAQLKREVHDGSRALEDARQKAATLQRATLDKSGPELVKAKAAASAARKESAKLGAAHEKQRIKLQKLRDTLHGSGVKTGALSKHQVDLRKQIDAATNSVQRQERAYAVVGKRAAQIARLNHLHKQWATHMREVGIQGAVWYATATQMARPIKAVVSAFAESEDSATQLRANMMRADGGMSEGFERLTALADQLSSKLPATKSELQDMMLVLTRKGMSASSILAGIGESAAKLSLVMKLPAAEAAEFAVKLKEVTGAADDEMLGLADTAQRLFNMGEAPDQILTAFESLTPALRMMRMEGKKGADAMAPLLSMLGGKGMDFDIAGEAVARLVKTGMDAAKVTKANDLLGDMGAGINLDFTDGKGGHGGIRVMFEQLQKLRAIKDEVKRASVLKALIGNNVDAQQAAQAMMDEGMAGYTAAVAQMKAQADLDRRVAAQMDSLKNIGLVLKNMFVSVMLEVGEVVAPSLKQIAGYARDLTARLKSFIKEHPQLVKSISLGAVGFTALAAVVGGASLLLVSISGPLQIITFLLTKVGLKSLWFAVGVGGKVLKTLRALGPALALLGSKGFAAMKLLGRGVMIASRALWVLAANPLALAIAGVIAAVAALAYAIYKYWNPIKAFAAKLWTSITDKFDGFVAKCRSVAETIKGAFTAAWDGIKDAFSSAWTWITDQFDGFVAKCRAIIETLLAPFRWLMEKLGIGLAAGAVATAAAASPSAGVTPDQALPRIEIAKPAPVTAVKPLGKYASNRTTVIQGDTIGITVQAAPGMDEKAVGRAVVAELNKRQAQQAARQRSSLRDTE